MAKVSDNARRDEADVCLESGALAAFVLAIAMVFGLWFSSVFVLVRGLVDAASSSQVMAADSGETVR